MVLEAQTETQFEMQSIQRNQRYCKEVLTKGFKTIDDKMGLIMQDSGHLKSILQTVKLIDANTRTQVRASDWKKTAGLPWDSQEAMENALNNENRKQCALDYFKHKLHSLLMMSNQIVELGFSSKMLISTWVGKEE